MWRIHARLCVQSLAVFPLLPALPPHLSSVSSLSSSRKIANKTDKEFKMQIGKHLGKRRETLFGKHRKHPAKWIRTQPTCARRDKRSATARVRPRCAACKDTSIGGRPAPLRLRWGDRRAARALRELRMSVPGGRRVPGVPVVDVVGVVGYENRGKNGQGVQNASRDLVAGTPAGTRVYTRVNSPDTGLDSNRDQGRAAEDARAAEDDRTACSSGPVRTLTGYVYLRAPPLQARALFVVWGAGGRASRWMVRMVAVWVRYDRR